MTRRRALAAGVAVAAASAGLGFAWWRQNAQPAGDSGQGNPEPSVDVWRLRFETPQGGEVALDSLRGKPLVLNFWATWCPPCVEEMPLLDRFLREHGAAGWQVFGLAVDNAAPVREFLARHPVDFPIGLAGMQGVALSRSLGNRHGALPFSVIYDSQGTAVERKLGAASVAELGAWARRIR
jgi:thiol-disulfide isomerase/thioredoxin